MEYQQFMLRCQDFYERISVSIQKLFAAGKFADVTIACDGMTFKAHKMILSACSPYFCKIFQQNPCKHPVIMLQDVDEKIMKNILSFIYYGEVNIDTDALESFLRTAKFLQVEGLAEVESTEKNSKIRSLTEFKLPERVLPPEKTNENCYGDVSLKSTPPPSPSSAKIDVKPETLTIDSDDEDIIMMESVTTIPSTSQSPLTPVLNPSINSTIGEPLSSPINPALLPILPGDEYVVDGEKDMHVIDPITCVICEKKIRNKFYLRCHILKEHNLSGVKLVSGTQVLNCPMCQERFHNKRDLNAHVLIIHQKVNYNGLNCSVCNKQFSSVSNRNQHILKFHAKILT